MAEVARRPGGVIHIVRRSRRRRECAWNCGTPIERGEAYVRSSLPPRTDVNESESWWSHDLHGHAMTDCPTFVHADPAPGVDNPGNW